MNKDIEILKEIEKYYAQDIIQKTEPGKSKLSAIRSAISTLEAVEKAEGVLPEKRYTKPEQCTSNDIYRNSCKTDYILNKTIDLCTPVVAKLIKERDELKDEYDKLKDNFSLYSKMLEDERLKRVKAEAELSRTRIGVEELAKEIMSSKIITFTKKLERHVAKLEGIKFDDERDLWLEQKAKELSSVIIHKLYGGK